MTNEELATAIKDGNSAWYADLWEQVKRFVFKKASLFYLFKKDVCTRHGITLEDLNQCGYFALVDAVKAWTPESGFKVTSYLNLQLKRHFNAALSGGRVRNATDCLNCCESLDKPMGDDLEGLSLEDAIPDPAAEQDMEDAENRVFFGELREEMKRCLSSIDQEQADILRMQFFEGKTQGEIAERIGKSCQRVHQIRSKGLRELRKPQYSRQLLPYAEYLDLLAWRSTGFSAFQNGGLSSVEKAVERLSLAAGK